MTHSGDHDGTVVYWYGAWKIIETRDGSDTMVQQFIHGTQYIDELVMMRAAEPARVICMFISQVGQAGCDEGSG